MTHAGVGKAADGTQKIEIEMPHRDGWWISALYILIDGEPTLAELRVFPGDGRDDSYSFGEWSESAAGLRNTSGPLTTRLLRGVKLNEMSARAKREVDKLAPKLGQ